MSMPRLEEILPHRPPMILLTALVDYDAESARCLTHIDEASPFFDIDLNAVPAYIGIEYMAQAVAAWSGARARQSHGAVKPGFLLGTRRYAPSVSLFPHGAELLIEVRELVQDDSGLGIYECSIHCNGELWVNARLNVFQPDQPPTEMMEP